MTHSPTTLADGDSDHDAQRSAAIEITGLRVSYRVGRKTKPVLHGIDLAIPSGSIVAIVGESGSGKSTLAHSLLRLLPSNASITAGEIGFDGRDLTRATERDMRRIRGARIGFVPQDPMMALNPTQKIGQQISEAVALHARLTASELSGRVDTLLADAGLSDPSAVRSRYPHELSGGMRQRVLIAIAFASSPEIIIADEPTSALDASVSNHVLDTLQRQVTDKQVTLLIITHDLALASRRADHVVVMSQGLVVESGPAEAVFTAPQHEYTRGLVENSLQLRPRTPRSRGNDRARAETIVTLQDVSKRYDTGQLAVDEVTFEVARGSTFALVGESGSGKSSTVRMLLGLETITSGSISVFGSDVGDLGRAQLRDLRRRAQVVYQSPYASLDPRFSVASIIDEPLRAYRTGDARSRRGRVRELLDRVGLPAEYATRRPAELSGGQRQRVAIARALALSPELVICDEPVSALDASVQAQILDLLLEIQRDLEVTYIFISHDLAVVADIAHDVGVMQAGRLVESGPAHRIFADPQHPYTRQLLDAAYGRSDAPV